MLSTLSRKFLTLVRNPRNAVSAKWRRLRAWHARRRMQRLHLNELLTRRPADAIPPDALDLVFLYSLVVDRGFAKILEFGSGCSTIVMAEALRRNAAEGRCSEVALVSVETVERWAEAARDIIPPNLRTFCNVCIAPLEITNAYGPPAFLHTGIPRIAPDLIYVDGPELTDEVQVAADALQYEENLKPGAMIVVDGRVKNVDFLRRNLKRRYRIRTDNIRHNTVFELLRD